VSTANSTEFQSLLEAVDRDEPGAFDRLVEAVYPELKRLAHFQLANERPGHSLNTTAIVHEAYVRLSHNQGWVDRRHFLRASARVMRHLLVDHARKVNAKKRGDGEAPLPLDESQVAADDDTLAVLALDRAIEDMRTIDARLMDIVECRYFAGLSVEDTAEALGTSVRTVERDSRRARAYLLNSLAG
jgi:RNA polymerase sigma factor (TIGR02999 family)